MQPAGGAAYDRSSGFYSPPVPAQPPLSEVAAPARASAAPTPKKK